MGAVHFALVIFSPYFISSWFHGSCLRVLAFTLWAAYTLWPRNLKSTWFCVCLFWVFCNYISQFSLPSIPFIEHIIKLESLRQAHLKKYPNILPDVFFGLSVSFSLPTRPAPIRKPQATFVTITRMSARSFASSFPIPVTHLVPTRSLLLWPPGFVLCLVSASELALSRSVSLCCRHPQSLSFFQRQSEAGKPPWRYESSRLVFISPYQVSLEMRTVEEGK